MKKALYVAGALVLLPSIGHTQEFAPLPGFYIGAGVGGAWYLNSTTTVGGTFSGTTGMLADVVAGYDFVGPRVELEVGFGFIPFTANLANTAAQSNFSGSAHQLQVMGKRSMISFRRRHSRPISARARAWPSSTATPSWATRRSPTRASRPGLQRRPDVPHRPRCALLGTTKQRQPRRRTGYSNNNVSAMLSLQMQFGAPPVAAPPPPPPRRPPRRPSWCSSTGTARTCRSRP